MTRTSIVLGLLLVACGDEDKKGTGDTGGPTTADTAVTVPSDTQAATDSLEPHEVEDDTIADDTSAADSSIADSVADSSAGTETSEPPDVIVVETDVAPPTSCIDDGHTVGVRYAKGDDCNFCDCLADGTEVCSKHQCKTDAGGCTFDGRDYPYAARFDAGDDCNECVCAASGLACTRRCANEELENNSAVLLENLDEGCAGDPTFTGRAILDSMPYKTFETAFVYEHDRPAILYPETLPPTTIRVTVAYEEGGYIACRNPNDSQPAIDMEATIEMVTADGQFDEGFHTYLRRNNFGFLDAWMFAMGADNDDLDGSYDPNCLDPNGFSIGFLIFNSTGSVNGGDGEVDHHAEGDIAKACETDLPLTVGVFNYTPAE